MLTVSEAEWSQWLTLYLLPLFRLLGLIASAPLFSNRAIPVRALMALAIAATLAIAPALPPSTQPLPLGSWAVLPAIAAELLIGITIGFFLRLIFAAIDLAASFIGFQMGLSFAVFLAQQPVRKPLS